MTFVNKLKIKMKTGETFEFEIGEKTDLIDFWKGKKAIVQEISYKSIVDPTSDNIDIKAWPDNLVGAAGCLNIMKNEIEYYSYSYVVGFEQNK
jgi:hypothetical protein